MSEIIVFNVEVEGLNGFIYLNWIISVGEFVSCFGLGGQANRACYLNQKTRRNGSLLESRTNLWGARRIT